MKSSIRSFLTIFLSCVFFLMTSSSIKAQERLQITQKNEFWSSVRFGGGLGLNFGNNFTNVMVAPSAIYEEEDLIARAIRDFYSKDIDSIIVDGDKAFEAAKKYAKKISSTHAKNVIKYKVLKSRLAGFFYFF